MTATTRPRARVRARAVKPDTSAQVFSFRAPRGFFADLERGLFVRPDGEVVTIRVNLDEANRWAVPRFTAHARTGPWKVRLARWLLGMAEKEYRGG